MTGTGSKPYTNKKVGIGLEYKHCPPKDALLGYSLSGSPWTWELVNEDEVILQRVRTLEIIAKENGYELSDMTGMAKKLAENYDERLRYYIKKKPGRGVGWTEYDSMTLWLDVEVLREKGMSISSACEILGNKGAWKKYSAATLKSKYSSRVKDSPWVYFLKRMKDELGAEFFDLAGDFLSLEKREKSRAAWKTSVENR